MRISSLENEDLIVVMTSDHFWVFFTHISRLIQSILSSYCHLVVKITTTYPESFKIIVKMIKIHQQIVITPYDDIIICWQKTEFGLYYRNKPTTWILISFIQAEKEVLPFPIRMRFISKHWKVKRNSHLSDSHSLDLLQAWRIFIFLLPVFL